MQEIRKKGITSAKKMFVIANKHDDCQDDVNASLGKYNERTDEQVGEGPSSPRGRTTSAKATSSARRKKGKKKPVR